MKVGSLVMLLDRKVVAIAPIGVYFPANNIIYTVRSIEPGETLPNECIRLEEIVNPIAPNGREWAFNVKNFRELLPPMEISIESILEKELIYQP